MNDDYTKGFNEGYVLAGHLPRLARSLSKAESASPRMAGFREGRRQYLREQGRGPRLVWSDMYWDTVRSRDHAPDRIQEQDSDDREVEY